MRYFSELVFLAIDVNIGKGFGLLHSVASRLLNPVVELLAEALDVVDCLHRLCDQCNKSYQRKYHADLEGFAYRWLFFGCVVNVAVNWYVHLFS
jgi:large-conductance mechanosensitive channel